MSNCNHKNRDERLWVRGQDLHAKVTCKDCHADLDLDHVLTLERAEKAEEENVELKVLLNHIIREYNEDTGSCMTIEHWGLDKMEEEK